MRMPSGRDGLHSTNNIFVNLKVKIDKDYLQKHDQGFKLFLMNILEPNWRGNI